MTRNFSKDYNKGINSENEILNTLEKYFEERLERSISKYAKYDFKGSTTGILYELKTRNLNHNAYPTTIIAEDKIISGHKQIFIFRFNDGIYFIKYDAELFQTFMTEKFIRNNPAAQDREKPYMYIPYTALTKI